MSSGGGGGQGHLTCWAAASCWVQMPVLTDHPSVRIPQAQAPPLFPTSGLSGVAAYRPGCTSEAAGWMGWPGTQDGCCCCSATSAALRGRVTRPRGGQLRDLVSQGRPTLKATECTFTFSLLINSNGSAPFSAVKRPDSLYRGKKLCVPFEVLAAQTGGTGPSGGVPPPHPVNRPTALNQL